eukprot:TRINITY_DN179_c0_g1_i2.p1 TRINITY_DN179_c0_g1~~TRINITY_DN179_c0_g1_i2.p1  ORF type:complete len:637 (+),score=93.20 TRINITY_DN179_c0_g1_i2:363-2273(+)
MASPAVLPALHIETTLVGMKSGLAHSDLDCIFPAADQKLCRLYTESRLLQFKDSTGHITTLSVKPWHTLKEVREQLAADLSPNGTTSPRRFRLFCRGHELSYKRTVDACHLKNQDVIHVSTESNGASKLPKLEVLCGSACPEALVSILSAAREGLERGNSPELTPSGLGGTYFLKNEKAEVVGVFKPEDEEAGGPNNPKGHTGCMGCPSVRSGVLSGEANLREVAAYMLDHQEFANVPATVRVEVKHAIFGEQSKIGSFQEFKRHDEEAGDLSSSLFSQDEAHKIAIMDIRLLNTDRNDENLLVRRHDQNNLELIPIDHGCSLPSTLQVNWHDWSWLSWPQTKRPFSKVEKDYISALNASNDSLLLSSELNMAWRNLLMLNIATTFLQKGAAADLTLFDIASMMVRDDPPQPSPLESIFPQSRALAETKRGGSGGLLPRRSPAIKPVAPRSPLSPSLRGKKGLRRTNSNIDLAQLSAFSLPPSEIKRSTKARDDHTWETAEEEQQQESFDEVFFEYVHDLMDSVISQRLSKKRALSIMTSTFKSSPVKAPPKVVSLNEKRSSRIFFDSPQDGPILRKDSSGDALTPLQTRLNMSEISRPSKPTNKPTITEKSKNNNNNSNNSNSTSETKIAARPVP